MIQPGRDEISQGVDGCRSRVAAKLISFGDARRARLRRLFRYAGRLPKPEPGAAPGLICCSFPAEACQGSKPHPKTGPRIAASQGA
jgi:hypothetical protein